MKIWKTGGVASNKSAIQFGTYVGRDAQTRGTVTDNETIKTTGFGVTAWYTGQSAWAAATAATAPNFMYNQKVTYGASAFEYTPVKYWPTMKNDKISFFAYAPYAATTGDNGITMNAKDATKDNTSLTFTVNDDAAKMVDFVAATAIDKTQKDDAKGGQDAVNFAFKHELSRVAFMVKTSDDLKSNSHVVITKAEVLGSGTFYKSATYTFANTNTEATGTWSKGTAATTDYTLANVLATTKGKIAGKQYDGNVDDVTSATAKSLFKDKEYLFLIPMSAGTLSSDKVAVRFTYDIVTEDSNLKDGYSCTPATKTVYLPTGILAQGKAYTVTFTFNMDEIEVSASVADWGNVSDGGVNVPFTPDDATKTTK